MELQPLRNVQGLTQLVGHRAGLLTVLEPLGAKHFRRGVQVVYRCRCDCGEIVQRDKQTLLKSPKPSCGCTKRAKFGTHAPGATKHPLHKCWRHMIDRCTNPENKSYPDYGARGITVCERWLTGEGELTGFGCFVADMGERPEGLTLERRDYNGRYEPSNCEWADRLTQGRNRRNLRLVEWRGRRKPVSVWSEETGVPYFTLLGRLNAGWDVERAFTAPIDTRKGHRRKAA